MAERVDYALKIDEWEKLLKEGLISRFRESFTQSELNLRQVPRRYRLRIANCLRRAGQTTIAMKLLSPVIRHEIEGPQASPAEVIEYATNLNRIGAGPEALMRLEQLDGHIEAKVFLYRAMVSMEQWDYAKAIPMLEAYIASKQVQGYQKAIAETNLALAHFEGGDRAEAVSRTQQLLINCQQRGWNRLTTVALNILAMNSIEQGQLGEAKTHIDQNQQLMQSEGVIESYMSLKTQALFEVQKQNSLQPLKDYRQFTVEKKLYERTRDADYALLKQEFQQATLDHLYFGSSFAAFRNRLVYEFGRVSETYSSGANATKAIENGALFDLFSGELQGASEESGQTSAKTILNVGKALHLYINSLCSDFYRPAKIGHLFSEVFADEEFDPYSSANRVYQLSFRLRQWIEDNQLPLQLHEEKGEYRLAVDSGLTLIKSQSPWPLCEHAAYYDKVCQSFGFSPFTAKDLQQATGLKKSKALEVIKSALKRQIVVKSGQGKSVRYQMNMNFPLKTAS